MDLPDDLATGFASFIDRLVSATDLGTSTRDKYRRSTAAFLVWLAAAREAGALDQRALLRFLRTVARDAPVRDGPSVTWLMNPVAIQSRPPPGHRLQPVPWRIPARCRTATARRRDHPRSLGSGFVLGEWGVRT
ncbi:hypothetical protein GCM10023405_21910 [Streptomonospora salina]